MIKYLKQLIANNTKESSKRFIAIFTAVGLVALAFIYTNSSNIVTVLTILTTYVLALIGVTVYDKFKNNGGNE
jgi:hypothetical protein